MIVATKQRIDTLIESMYHLEVFTQSLKDEIISEITNKPKKMKNINMAVIKQTISSMQCAVSNMDSCTRPVFRNR